MQRYFIDKVTNPIIGSDFHHIKNVMRMKPKDEIIVCANNESYLVRITAISDHIDYEVIKKLPKKRVVDITLLQGLPKHPKPEFICKYATMFNVTNIIFTPFDRSIARLENIETKQKRLSLISKEASELASRDSLVNISFIKKLNEIDYSLYDLILVADEEETNSINGTFDFKKALIVIGPEGGISNNERIFFRSINAKSISLGDNILATEVASLYLLSIINNSLK